MNDSPKIEQLKKHLDLDVAVKLAELEDGGIKLQSAGRGFEFVFTDGSKSRYLADETEVAEEILKMSLESGVESQESDSMESMESTNETPDSRLQTPDSRLQTPDFSSDEQVVFERLQSEGWQIRPVERAGVSRWLMTIPSRVFDPLDGNFKSLSTRDYGTQKAALSAAQGLDTAYKIIDALHKCHLPQQFFEIIEEYDLHPLIDGSYERKFWMVEDVEVTVLEKIEAKRQSLNLHRVYQDIQKKTTSSLFPEIELLFQEILIKKITVDHSIQARTGINYEKVDEYADEIKSGAKFPPVDIFYDGNLYWLARGFHRLPAHEKAGLDVIDCKIHEGSRREAMLSSIGDNAEHGLPRTPEDKFRAVEMLLKDDEWKRHSNETLSKLAKVSAPFVKSVKERLGIKTSSVVITASGTEINTENIGRKKKEEKPAPLFEDSGITVVHDPQKIYEAMRDTAGESQESGVESQESEESPKSDDAKSQESWGHIFALVDKLKANMPDGLLQVTLIEQGFPKEVIGKAIEKHLVERDENGRVFHIFTQEEVVELIQKCGPMNFLELEEKGVKSHVINLAKSNGLIELKSGKFNVHEDNRDSETEEELKAWQTPDTETIDESQMEVLPPVEDNPAWDNAEIFIKIQLLPKQEDRRIALYSVGEDGVFGDLLDAPADEILSNLPACILNLIDKVKKEMKERKPVKAQAKKTTKTASKSPAKKPAKRATKTPAKKPVAKSSTSSKSKSVKSVTKG